MLYDKRWEKTETRTKPPIFSVEGLAAWLETKDPATQYFYGDIHNCLLSQYFRARGYRWAYCGPTRVSFSRFFLPPLFSRPIPREMDNIAFFGAHTFGAALSRARKAASR